MRTSVRRLIICTASGKSVFEKNLTFEDNVSNLSFLPAGMYVAYLRDPGIHENEKNVIFRKIIAINDSLTITIKWNI